MPPPFKQLHQHEVAAFVENYPFRRQITDVHLHHTWRPNHSQYKGQSTIKAMYDYHTITNGWNDIAQHATVAPDGTIWLGRNWNSPPASASGHNGSGKFGPFMIEMIGDFDKGRDVLKDPQLKSVLELIARVQLHFGLSPETLRFHNEMSGKTCPGNSIDRQALLKDLKAHLAALKSAPPPSASRAKGPFPSATLQVCNMAQEHGRRETSNDSADAELQESDSLTLSDLSPSGSYEPASRQRGGDDTDLTASTLAALRPHVINLTGGMFSSDGIFTTTPGDVDAIFQQYLPRELAARSDAGQALRIVFYAHGGLVSESNGLKIATQHIPWWLKNGVYPIYFVWETGLFETVGALLQRIIADILPGGRGTRDLWDYTTDPLVERAARALQGVHIWGGMKHHAAMASSSGGGANYTAQQLGKFLAAHSGTSKKPIELHAIGHSAGSIFHSHFLPTALDAANGATFRTVQFMAPAIRVDEFQSRLAGVLGKGIDHLTMFTMKKDFERDDNCMHIYRKSLLYLIHRALEPESETPILGLEESVRNNRELQRLFGLGGTAGTNADIVWSVSSESGATTHGGFDDDAPTMESILRRITGTDSISQPFPVSRGFGDKDLRSWEGQVDWPEGLRMAEQSIAPSSPPSSSSSSYSSQAAVAASAIIVPHAAGTGKRRGLCVGINHYGGNNQLYGCVADAKRWKQVLESLGFQIDLLTDWSATRQGILSSLQQLVAVSQPGDVIVFQYAGHGTQLHDVDGDEATQDERDNLDEALVPIDFDQSACILDDDIAAITAALPERVNLTSFIDCCHSGTATRMLMGGTHAARNTANYRARYMVATPAMEDINREFHSQKAARGIRSRSTATAQRDILFSACSSRQTAKEHGAQGDFTLAATQVLSTLGTGISNDEFLRRTTSSFSGWDDQTPELWCNDLFKHRSLLAPFP
ncbi:MAG: caspase family protein [Candidatus Kapabacteria bacterium]|nr:caspase family protein [Candidatus Kapabacteria bacterium]